MTSSEERRGVVCTGLHGRHVPWLFAATVPVVQARVVDQHAVHLVREVDVLAPLCSPEAHVHFVQLLLHWRRSHEPPTRCRRTFGLKRSLRRPQKAYPERERRKDGGRVRRREEGERGGTKENGKKTSYEFGCVGGCLVRTLDV